MVELKPFWVSTDEKLFPLDTVVAANEEVGVMRSDFRQLEVSRSMAALALDTNGNTAEIPIISY